MEKNFIKPRLYRVQQTDTLTELAEKFNITINKIIADNNLKHEIEAGDVLLINSNLNIYTVKLNDTIENIAKKFNTTPQKIKQDNSIDYIYYGLKIMV